MLGLIEGGALRTVTHLVQQPPVTEQCPTGYSGGWEHSSLLGFPSRSRRSLEDV